MNAKDKILEDAAAGRLGFAEAVAKLAASGRCGSGELAEARIDHARRERCGFPEFVYGAGKSLDQLLAIVPEILGRTGSVLVTRIPAEYGAALLEAFPAGRARSARADVPGARSA